MRPDKVKWWLWADCANLQSCQDRPFMLLLPELRKENVLPTKGLHTIQSNISLPSSQVYFKWRS